MNKRQTWDEIRKRYPDEWVVLVDYTIDGTDLVEGAVIDHGTVKKEATTDDAILSSRRARRAVAMGEKLTWDEIKRRYPDQWVVLVDLDPDEGTWEVRGGVVFGHSKNQTELLAATKEALAGRSRAVIFTGEVGRGNFLF